MTAKEKHLHHMWHSKCHVHDECVKHYESGGGRQSGTLGKIGSCSHIFVRGACCTVKRVGTGTRLLELYSGASCIQT